MWKKDDVKTETATPSAAPQPQPQAAPERPIGMTRTAPDNALIGRSITIRGDVTGDEDLVIQGRIEGSVNLRQHAVTVGNNGEVSADITGRIVTIEGRVVGNIDGGEQVTLRSAAFVQGDITAPRVVLENGARFRGLVDMGEGDDRRGGKGAVADAKRSAGSGRSSSEAPKQEKVSGAASSDASDPVKPAESSTNGAGKHRPEPEPQLAR